MAEHTREAVILAKALTSKNFRNFYLQDKPLQSYSPVEIELLIKTLSYAKEKKLAEVIRYLEDRVAILKKLSKYLNYILKHYSRWELTVSFPNGLN